MKNRRNIVEQKYPPENPNDIWLKDGKFYHSTSEGWTVIDSEMEYTNKTSMIADKPKGGTIGINKETGEPSIYNDVTKQWNPLSGSVNIITWQELKDKRDAGELTPGSLYRITDYQCTTTQENTRSAGHQFDIVLLALSENKLAEEGWAMMNESNIYDVTFADGVTKKCWLYEEPDSVSLVDYNTHNGGSFALEDIIINEVDKTVDATDFDYDECMTETNLTYNYFQNSNLSAWKVWYCLDNDKSRFAWADDSEDFSIPNTIKVSNKLYIRDVNNDRTYNNNQYYAWSSGKTYYTLSENPEINDVIYKWGTDPFNIEAGSNVMSQQSVRVSAVTSGYEGRAKEAIITYYDDHFHNNLSFKRDTTTNNGVLINNGITYYLWVQEDNLTRNVYTLSEYPEVGDSLYRIAGLGGDGLEQFAEISSYQPPIHYYNGRGVIYRLIDEWNNDVPYDFKNILIYNETYSQYCYAIIDNTENNFDVDPTLDGTKVKAIRVLCDNNDELKPLAKGGFGNNPLVNIIFLNNNTLADECSNCVVSNGLPIVS